MKQNTSIFIMMALASLVFGQLESSQELLDKEVVQELLNKAAVMGQATKIALERLKELKSLVAGLAGTVKALETIGDITELIQFLIKKAKVVLGPKTEGKRTTGEARERIEAVAAQAIKEIEEIKAEQKKLRKEIGVAEAIEAAEEAVRREAARKKGATDKKMKAIREKRELF